MTSNTDLFQQQIPPVEFARDLTFGNIKKAMHGSSSRDLWNVKAADIDSLLVMEGLNARIDCADLTAHIRALANSMIADGYKQSKPIEVFILEVDGVSVKYVSDGHCRLKAVKLALSEGALIEQITVVTLPTKGLTLQDIVVGLVRSNSGRSLTPYETALVCKRLANYSWSSAKIGESLGFTPDYVELLLEAVSAPMSIVTMMQNGEVALTTAVEILRKHGSNAVGVLKSGLAVAVANGKKKVTPGVIPGAAIGKLIKRQAQPLFAAVKSISADPGFSGLSVENQKLLSDLLAGIADKEAKIDAKLQKQAQPVAAS
jgi:ParB family chromosome partitioning protein